MMTSDSNTLSDFEWRYLVGGFMLSFADIELITHQLWNELFPNEKIERIFSKRVTQIVAQLSAIDPSNMTIEYLNESKDLAKIRNIIAHNPLQVEIYKHTRTGQHFFDQGIFCKKSDFYISETRLRELCEQVERLSVNLHIALGHV